MAPLVAHRTWEVASWAKVNLFLEVVRKRPDGFHELLTLMAAIQFADVVQVRATESPEILVACTAGHRYRWGYDGGQPLEGERNLAFRAARALQTLAGEKRGAEIRIFKRIPIGAGLGGGSSNAAAVLRLCSIAWGLELRREELHALARGLGSDVAFFLSPSAMVLVGRGDEPLRPVAVPAVPLVICVPRQGNETGKVFARTVIPKESDRRPLPCGGTSLSRRGVESILFNRLTEAAMAHNPELERNLKRLTMLGGGAPLVTGSGSGCFAVCATARTARRLARRLRGEGIGDVFATRLASSPSPSPHDLN